MGDTFRIVAFVGGGIRGLMSAVILDRLTQVNPELIDHADMLAGTSTGSVIVSHLVAGQTPGDIVDAYRGPMVQFYDKQDTDPHKPAYDVDEAYAAQLALNPDVHLSDVTAWNVLFTAFDVGDANVVDDKVMPTPWAPVLYTNMEVDSPLVRNDALVAEAAMASGTMPGQFGSLFRGVDGAFLNHDPTIPAIALAIASGVELEDIVAITIGTGLMDAWIASDSHLWGADEWMNGDDNPFSNTVPFFINLDGPTPALDMTLNGTSTNLMPDLASMLLGDRYANINPKLPCFIPENSTSAQDLGLLEACGVAADTSAAQSLISTYWTVGQPS